jgi:DNA-binding CsgD family transcriptional regulator
LAQNTKADLPRCFEIYPPLIDAAGPNQALCVWEQLLQSPGFKGAVVEDHRSSERANIVGFGASVFVSDDFAQQEMRNAEPGLLARVISDFVAHKRSVLSLEHIGFDNAENGLNLLVLAGRCVRGLDAEGILEVQVLLPTAFVELHAGYYVKRILTELVDSQDLHHAVASRLWRLIPYTGNGPFDDRHLGLIEAPDVRFRRHVPQLSLRPTDQELLVVVLGGATDEEIAIRLHITLSAVKRRWEDIYNRVYSSGIDIGFTVEAQAANGKRGAQKRHVLLAYLRRHPEELRPYRSKPHTQAARLA